MNSSVRRRAVAFAIVAAVTLAATSAYVLRSGHRAIALRATAVAVRPAGGLAAAADYLFRSTAPGPAYGRVAFARTADLVHPALSNLRCDRVDFAGGRGMCLALDQHSFQVRSTLTLFDSDLHARSTSTVAGYPSRTRVSPDGRYGATTTFVSGHSYAEAGFSTSTTIFNLRSGAKTLDLETMRVRRDGSLFHAVDFNFWGVTFAHDSRHFYATLASGGQTFLIEGDLTSGEAIVLRTGVECPALSPDDSQIAFKLRMPGSPVTWRVAVIDLATLQDHPLAELRDVDDQPAWLDDHTVMYGVTRPYDTGGAYVPAGLPLIAQGVEVSADTWGVPADGSGQPARLIADSWSARPVR